MNELILLTLAVAVPLNIALLLQQGGPTDEQIERAQAMIAEQALSEAILFHIPGETGPQAARLAEILAIMAFQPGGVRAFGLKFDGARPAFGRMAGGTTMLATEARAAILDWAKKSYGDDSIIAVDLSYDRDENDWMAELSGKSIPEHIWVVFWFVDGQIRVQGEATR